MKKLITFLSVGYALYALLIGFVVAFVLLRVRDAQVVIILFASLAILLARRRARRTARVIAGISCLGIPMRRTTVAALSKWPVEPGTRSEARVPFTFAF